MDKRLFEQVIPVTQIYTITQIEDQQTIHRLEEELASQMSETYNETFDGQNWNELLEQLDIIYNNIKNNVEYASDQVVNSQSNLLSIINNLKISLANKISSFNITTDNLTYTQLINAIDQVKQQGDSEQTAQILNEFKQGISEHIYGSINNLNNATIESIIGVLNTYNAGFDNEYIEYDGGVLGQIRSLLIGIYNNLNPNVIHDTVEHRSGIWTLVESIGTSVTNLINEKEEYKNISDNFNINDAPEWQQNLSYNIGDIRTYNNNVYLCLTQHTDNSGDYNPEDTLNIWQQLT